MTTTILINAVTVGATPTAVSNITAHTFVSTSGAFNLQASLTAGTQASDSKVVIYYAPMMDNLTATLANVKKVLLSSFRLEVSARVPMQEQLFTTDIEGCRGRYLLVWLEEPLLAASGTLTVKVTEY